MVIEDSTTYLNEMHEPKLYEHKDAAKQEVPGNMKNH